MERQDRLAVAALACLAVVGLTPLVVPALWGGPVVLPEAVALAGRALVVLLCAALVAARCRLDGRQGLWPAWLSGTLVVGASLMTVLHYLAIDVPNRATQYDLYYNV